MVRVLREGALRSGQDPGRSFGGGVPMLLISFLQTSSCRQDPDQCVDASSTEVSSASVAPSTRVMGRCMSSSAVNWVTTGAAYLAVSRESSRGPTS